MYIFMNRYIIDPELQTVLYQFFRKLFSKLQQKTNIFRLSGNLPTNLPSKNQPFMFVNIQGHMDTMGTNEVPTPSNRQFYPFVEFASNSLYPSATNYSKTTTWYTSPKIYLIYNKQQRFDFWSVLACKIDLHGLVDVSYVHLSETQLSEVRNQKSGGRNPEPVSIDTSGVRSAGCWTRKTKAAESVSSSPCFEVQNRLIFLPMRSWWSFFGDVLYTFSPAKTP